MHELPKDVLKMASGLISPSGLAGHRRPLCNAMFPIYINISQVHNATHDRLEAARIPCPSLAFSSRSNFVCIITFTLSIKWITLELFVLQERVLVSPFLVRPVPVLAVRHGRGGGGGCPGQPRRRHRARRHGVAQQQLALLLVIRVH